jgi:Uma2 family endonuclease
MIITNINQLDLEGTYTYADYLKWQFDEIVEIIKGRVYKMSPAPLRYHQQISVRITSDIDQYLRRKMCKVYSAPFDVRFPVNGEEGEDAIYTVVQPDICVVCDLEKLDDKGCLGSPDMIVEIISPSTAKKDTNEKYNLYESAGVREYWIVFPKERFIMVHLLNDKGVYDLVGNFEPNADTPTIKVNIFPDLELIMEDIFSI